MEDMRITGLTLNGVGVFEHLELSFKKKPLKDKAEIHIFTGENGTGKTTLLEALTYFDRFFNKKILEVKRLQNNPINIKIKRGFIGKNETAVGIYFPGSKLEFSNVGNVSFVNHELIEDYYKRAQFDNFQFSNYCFFAYNGHRQLNDTKVEAFKNFDFNPITEALTFNKTNINENLFQWIANNKTRAALSFQKGNIKDSEKYLATIQKIEAAIGEIIGRKIEFIIDEQSLNVMVKLDNDPVYYNSLADGYKSVISWLTDLMFRLDYMPKEGQENFTLFLDEIDVHLHPAAQRRILPVIQKLFPKAQIFLTTHSPFVIGSVDDAWVYKFKLNEKGKSVLDGEPFLTEDANSYRYILEHVFDIKKQFGEEVEKKIELFYKLRDEAIKTSSDELFNEVVHQGRNLAAESFELQAIMGSELKQLARILKKDDL